MARRGICVAVGLQVWRQSRKRAAAHRDKQRIAECAKHRKGVLAGAGDADRRVRLLIWPWHSARLVERMVLPLIAEAGLRPGELEDVQRLVEPFAALAVGHAIGGIASRVAAAARTQKQAATAD